MARRNDHTREELEALTVKTAENIIKNEGFHKLTARRLAKEIGYTPGTLYNIFGSMDGLYFVINARTLDRLYEALYTPEKFSREKSLTENLKLMAKTYINFALENKEFWLLMFQDTSAQVHKTPDWYREKIKEQFVPLEKLLSPVLKNKKAETEMAARAIWSCVHGLCFMRITGKLGRISDRKALDIAGCLIENFVAGLEKS